MRRLEKISKELGNGFAGFLNYAIGDEPFSVKLGASWGFGVSCSETHFFELWLDPENDGLGFFIRAYSISSGYTMKMEFIGINRVAPTQWVTTANDAVMILMSFVGSQPYETAKKKWANMPEKQKQVYFTF